jgi:hypothetical protein
MAAASVNADWKATLGEHWQYEETFPALAASNIDRSRSNAAIRACRSN